MGLRKGQSLDARLAVWHKSLEKLGEAEAASVGELLDQTLSSAGSSDEFKRVRRDLLALLAASDRVTSTVNDLLRRTDALEAEWAATNRYTEQGLAALEDDLRETAERRPSEAGRNWLNELIDAVRARELGAAAQIAAIKLPVTDELRPGADLVSAAVGHWLQKDAGAGLRLFDTIGSAELEGWESVLDVSLRSRAHRLAAWLALRVLGDARSAEDHLEHATELDPYGGPNYADRAALALFTGDLDRAAADAQRAIELAPDDPAGYLQLGAWAELSGQFDEARTLYQRGLERMPIHVVQLQSARASLLDPSGNLLAVAAEFLLAAKRPAAALASANAALAAGVRGTRNYPDADVYRLRSHALAALPEPDLEETALAGTEAAKRYLWNGQQDESVAELRRVLALHEVEEAGWFLADALVAQSFPTGAERPDQDAVGEARQRWELSAAKFGPPHGKTSWAYLNRAVIADFESYATGRQDLGSWEAALWVERALVHDQTESQRWGFAAKYLRAVSLDELALEAVERGYELSPTESVVLTERLALLANRGDFDLAEATAGELVALLGDDPWVSGVRGWLAFHRQRYADGARFFDLPIQGDYLTAWNLNQRALCHLGARNVDAARADYRSLLERVRMPLDGGDKCLLAIAATVVGDDAIAARWLEAAKEDPTTDPGDYADAMALKALADGELDRAIEFMREVIERGTTVREVEDAGTIILFRLSALEHVPLSSDRDATAQRVIAEESSKRIAVLEASPITADGELAQALEKWDDGASGSDVGDQLATLLAVRGRRERAAGRDADAAASYERLAGSAFEPEATRVLGELAGSPA